MNFVEYLGIVYVGGAILAAPLMLRLAKSGWEKDLNANKIAPGTEWAGLFITQAVSVLGWPLILPIWLVEYATQRARRRR